MSQSFELELALVDLPASAADKLARELPNFYALENKSKLGWGYVICKENCDTSMSLNEHVDLFFSGLASTLPILKNCSKILRVAIYNDKVTCTINIDDFDILASTRTKLELTVYPIEE